ARAPPGVSEVVPAREVWAETVRRPPFLAKVRVLSPQVGGLARAVLTRERYLPLWTASGSRSAFTTHRPHNDGDRRHHGLPSEARRSTHPCQSQSAPTGGSGARLPRMPTVGVDQFLAAALQNQMVRTVLRRAETLDLPDWYLAAGCLYQTVWNVVESQPPEQGILDYDIIYFDDADLSWQAEDSVIARCARAFDDLPVIVEVRNQARVRLWYEDHFGVPAPPLRSSSEAIDRYAAHACQVAIRSRSGRYEVYAPCGFDDLFALVLRPN